MSVRQQPLNSESECWRIAAALSFCVAKIAGKLAAYPDVDEEAFRRVYDAIREGLTRRRTPRSIADFCRELRGIVSCPVAELLRPEGADDVDVRITAIAQAVREAADLDDDLFRQVVTALLSWSSADKQLILNALTGIIRS